MDFECTDIAITSSDFWQNKDECTEEVLAHVFRSATDEKIPLFAERLASLREAGQILYEVIVLIAPGDLVFLTTSSRNMNATL